MEEGSSVEIQIYLQNVRDYIQSNEEAHSYFVGDGSMDTFMELLETIAIQNHQKNGEPQLTRAQFEFLRITVTAFKRVEEEEENSIYQYIPSHIKFYLK